MKAAFEVIPLEKDFNASGRVEVYVEMVARMALATAEKKKGEAHGLDLMGEHSVIGDFIFTLLVPHQAHCWRSQGKNYPKTGKNDGKKGTYTDDKSVLLNETYDTYMWGGQEEGKPPVALTREDLVQDDEDDEVIEELDQPKPPEPDQTPRPKKKKK